MSQAAQIVLGAANPFTTDPSFTYFESKYEAPPPSLAVSFEIPFDNQQSRFGTTSECTIPIMGDVLKGLLLRTTLPPIYPPQAGAYTYPQPSTSFDGTVFVQMGITSAVGDGTTLTANTTGSHYFSVGSPVTLSGTEYSIFNLDGLYTIATIPTANSFTCLSTNAGVAVTGLATVPGITPADIVGYYSTNNLDLWADNLTNKTWNITNAVVGATQIVITTSTPSGLSAGQKVHVIINSLLINGVYTVVSATQTTFIVNFSSAIFVAVSYHEQSMYSINHGQSWTVIASTPSGNWESVAYGNGTFVAVSFDGLSMYSNTNVPSWTLVSTPFGIWLGVAYGTGTFVAVSYDGKSMYSNTNVPSWTLVPVTPSGQWRSVAYGNGTFVAVSNDGLSMYSNTNVPSWATPLTTPAGSWQSITYGNGTFVAVSDDGKSMYSDTDVPSWTLDSGTPSGQWSSVAYTPQTYTLNQSDIAYLEPPPLSIAYNPSSTEFEFYSTIYPSISFANSQDAAFWGFDFLQGSSVPFVNGKISSTWTLTQGGWIAGFLPPSLSTYYDSVAHKLLKEVRILIGRQVINRYTGEFIELSNDLAIPYENKAIFKLLNGTLDATQAVAAREYYVSLPMGCDSIPIGALTRQQVSVEIDFEEYTNLSPHLNPGSGSFLDPKSYLAYDASAGILGGQPLNVQTTLSFQQYIFIITTTGNIVVYDTTKPVDAPDSYVVITALAGSSGVFSQFLAFGNFLFIQLATGYLIRGLIPELIQGNTSSFTLNNYLPTSAGDIGPVTGTMVADARYIYYAQSNLAQTNVFMTRYDTTTNFQTSAGYTSFDFTSNISPSTSILYQIITTGVKLIAITNTPGKFYTFNLNGNFTASWNSVDYSSVAIQITSGVLIGKTVYFIGDSYLIIKYIGDTFTSYVTNVAFVAVSYGGKSMYSINHGQSWTVIASTPPTNWYSIAYGNGTFVAVSYFGQSMYSNTNVPSWTLVSTPSGQWTRIAYGNGTFVAVSSSGVSMYSNTAVPSWTLVSGTPSGQWASIAYGNGTFVAVSYYGQSMYSNTNGQSWTFIASTPPDYWNSIAYGNGTFVAVSYFGQSIYSNTNVPSWTLVPVTPSGQWTSIAYGNGTFVAVSGDGKSMYSNTAVPSWTLVSGTPSGQWASVAYGNGTFVAVSYEGKSMYSDTDVPSWTLDSGTPNSQWIGVASSDTSILPNIGSGLTNLLAVGTTIYASSNSSSISSVIQIDTTKDLSNASAYQYYTSQTPNSPITFDGTARKIFANGPRYVYMFTNNAAPSPMPTTVYEYDPYPINTTFQASIIADFQQLSPSAPKPESALIKYVQSQHVTALSFADLQLLGPVKEFYVTGNSSPSNVFQYSNLNNKVSLTITGGEQILTPDVGTNKALDTITIFQTHTTLPVRNVSVIPFELNPESSEPNGTVNFSRLQYQMLSNGSSVWATSYNILKIDSGIGGLEFNSPY